jgi:hypothetical protein
MLVPLQVILAEFSTMCSYNQASSTSYNGPAVRVGTPTIRDRQTITKD